jgi:hypothetical protein
VSTVVTVSTSVDPADGIDVGWPVGRELEVARPWVRLPGDVFVTMPVTADEGAAAWWRRLAASAELIAKWYDRRMPAGGAR